MGYYRGARALTSVIESKAAELSLGDRKGGQYLVFTSVTQGKFTKLDRYRDTHHKSSASRTSRRNRY